MELLKKCNNCLIKKDISFFSIRDKKSGLLRAECKDCIKNKKIIRYQSKKELILEKNKIYYSKHKNKINNYRKEYYEKNKDIELYKRKSNYAKNIETVKLKRKEYYSKNKEKQISLVNNYIRQNLSKVRERQRKNHKKRIKVDLAYKIKKTLRSRVSSAIKAQCVKKRSKTVDLIGCSISYLKIHLEKQFKDGMNWSNHKPDGWHIDHIIPCSKFDLTDIEQQKICFNYKNLQPLWWYENIEKSNKLINK